MTGPRGANHRGLSVWKQPWKIRRQDNPLEERRRRSNHYSWRGRSTLQTSRRQRNNAAAFDVADRGPRGPRRVGSVGCRRRSHPATTPHVPRRPPALPYRHLGHATSNISFFSDAFLSVCSARWKCDIRPSEHLVWGGAGERGSRWVQATCLGTLLRPQPMIRRTADRYVRPAMCPTVCRARARRSEYGYTTIAMHDGDIPGYPAVGCASALAGLSARGDDDESTTTGRTLPPRPPRPTRIRTGWKN